MKTRILTFFVILFVSSNIFTEELTGFLDVKFGSTRQNVIKTMTEKGWIIDDSIKGVLQFKYEDSLFGLKTLGALFQFEDGKFTNGNVFSLVILIFRISHLPCWKLFL